MPMVLCQVHGKCPGVHASPDIADPSSSVQVDGIRMIQELCDGKEWDRFWASDDFIQRYSIPDEIEIDDILRSDWMHEICPCCAFCVVDRYGWKLVYENEATWRSQLAMCLQAKASLDAENSPK